MAEHGWFKAVKTLAVVVTHNRCVLLSRCLDHILRQTCQPASILVINNASSDGTVEMLKRRGIDFLSQENVGSAGGWHRGIGYALDHNFDSVWLMDDDGFPDVGALLALESALVTGVACASSVVLREDQPTHFVFPFPILDRAGLPVIFGNPRKLDTLLELSNVTGGGSYPFAHLFNGALVSLRAVAKVGNVNRDYFIYGEEVDYFFRLRSFGQVVSVLSALHYHPDVTRRPFNLIKIYYYIKNSLVLNSRYFNLVWVRQAMLLAVVLWRIASRNGIVFVFSMLIGNQAPAFYMAIFRGFRGKVGKDFNG
jgi:rhamnopyranosyl-N-acetylglucosaminyl-diphospho-decaprenol beta-1,3/1,4-galactofuranosyltransferase